MSTNLNKISAILKDQYLPALKNQITTAPSPFMELIKKVPLMSGGKITAAAPFGINGGFGFGSEGEGTPVSGSRAYKRFEVDPVDMYVDVRISDKTVKLANEAGALLGALEDEVMGSYEAAKWNVARALFGNGSGVLCKITSPVVLSDEQGTASFTVDNCSALIEGLTVDVYAYASSSDSEGALPSTNMAVRIKEIDRDSNTVVLDSNLLSVTVQSTAVNAYGFLTVQGSHNKEITGLKAIFDDGVKELYGYNKEKNAFICPLCVDAKNAPSDSTIYDAVKKALDYRNGKINLVMMGDNAFKAYQSYMRANNVVVCDKASFVGGATGYKVMVGSHTVTVVNERMVPANEAWCVDTEAFVFAHLEFDFCDYGSTGIFQLIPGTSYYRALLASYGNLICKNPGGCVKIINCAEA